MVDFAFLKKELEKVSSTTSNQSNKWKPPAGKSIIRLLPYRFNEQFPFEVLKFHYELNPSVLCLECTEGEGECPICRASQEYFNEGKEDAEARKLAKKLFARKRWFTPVYVREENGSEVNEMKIWGFGKQIFKQILDFYEEYEIDFTDTASAPDILVKFEEPSGDDTWGKTTIMVDPKTITKPKPLASTKKEIEAIVNSVPDIKEGYVHRTPKEAVEILSKYLKGLSAPSDEQKEKDIVSQMKAEKTKTKTKVEDDSDEAVETDIAVDDELDDLLNS